MLHRFLETVWTGDGQSLFDLAHKLELSADMVLEMAKELTHRGYLQEMGSDCDQPHPGCPDCAINQNCQVIFRHWVLTEKGRSVLVS